MTGAPLVGAFPIVWCLGCALSSSSLPPSLSSSPVPLASSLASCPSSSVWWPHTTQHVCQIMQAAGSHERGGGRPQEFPASSTSSPHRTGPSSSVHIGGLVVRRASSWVATPLITDSDSPLLMAVVAVTRLWPVRPATARFTMPFHRACMVGCAPPHVSKTPGEKDIPTDAHASL